MAVSGRVKSAAFHWHGSPRLQWGAPEQPRPSAESGMEFGQWTWATTDADRSNEVLIQRTGMHRGLGRCATRRAWLFRRLLGCTRVRIPYQRRSRQDLAILGSPSFVAIEGGKGGYESTTLRRPPSPPVSRASFGPPVRAETDPVSSRPRTRGVNGHVAYKAHKSSLQAHRRFFLNVNSGTSNGTATQQSGSDCFLTHSARLCKRPPRIGARAGRSRNSAAAPPPRRRAVRRPR